VAKYGNKFLYIALGTSPLIQAQKINNWPSIESATSSHS
jgi:hypothetical protein